MTSSTGRSRLARRCCGSSGGTKGRRIINYTPALRSSVFVCCILWFDEVCSSFLHCPRYLGYGQAGQSSCNVSQRIGIACCFSCESAHGHMVFVLGAHSTALTMNRRASQTVQISKATPCVSPPPPSASATATRYDGDSFAETCDRHDQIDMTRS
jgi:hypothetical protein